ncbi:MAG: glycoside hydrolase family 3 protein, partial [Anaerolineae bacterium]|nr:glycoside hydrolase family 3 protein [Anaerolineae bacterium]
VRAFQEAALKTRLAVPLLYGADCVHGHNNVKGAVIFPHNIGLGAARDEKLVYEIGRITAREMLATGVHWNFAPAVSVPQDIRWGRTYEGYSENTELVIKLSTAYIRGLQDSGVLASVKHFVADGATEWGTAPKPASHENNWQAVTDSYSIDQGDTQINEAVLRSVHLAPYIAAIEAGALNIMVSHSSWNGLKMHANHYLLTTVLKEECGFQGFLVSDWMAINQIDPDYYTCVVKSINAGLDMIMVPFDYKKFIEMLTLAVQKGDVLLERIDDAVRRILRAKYWLDLFNQPFGQEALLPEVGSPAHREVARQAVRQSLVLLKNEDKLLPLPKSVSKLLVAGQGADDIGLMCGGWSISWQGSAGATTQG